MPPVSGQNPVDPNDVNQKYIFVPFTVVITTAAIPANGGTITPFTLDQDADFELHYITGSCTVDNVAPLQLFQNNFSVLITDKSNSRIWGSDRVPQIQLCAPWNAGLPVRRPVMLARKTNLSFDVLNLSAANPNTVTICLQGFKVRVP